MAAASTLPTFGSYTARHGAKNTLSGTKNTLPGEMDNNDREGNRRTGRAQRTQKHTRHAILEYKYRFKLL